MVDVVVVVVVVLVAVHEACLTIFTNAFVNEVFKTPNKV